MPITGDRRDFNVTMRSGFISRWQWAVHAAVDCRTDDAERNLDDIRADACAELVMRIVSECNRGRALGARTVLLVIESDGEIAGFLNGTEGAGCIALSA